MRRYVKFLKNKGYQVNSKRVLRLMNQGSQFTSQEYVQILKDADCRISMDGKGRALDNIFVERLWRSFKHEEIYLNERPHSSLDGKTPAQVYFDERNFKRAS